MARASASAGEGEAGSAGAPSGDLYIFLSVKPHGFYSRDGADLFCRVPISMVAAALGTDIKVPTLDGKEAVDQDSRGHAIRQAVPPAREGMPVLRSKEMGDLYVQVVVETPQNLTKRQRELLE